MQRHVVLSLDDDGHLADPDCWSEAVARQFAAGEDVELSADHWRVIHAVRSFYLDTGVSPSMRALVRLVRERIGAEIGSSLALLCLFPGNAARKVAKIAGLERPDKCL